MVAVEAHPSSLCHSETPLLLIVSPSSPSSPSPAYAAVAHQVTAEPGTRRRIYFFFTLPKVARVPALFVLNIRHSLLCTVDWCQWTYGLMLYDFVLTTQQDSPADGTGPQASPGAWLEATARATLRCGVAGAAGSPPQDIVVVLKAFVDPPTGA